MNSTGKLSEVELEGTFLRTVNPVPASRLAEESGSRLHAVQGLRRKTNWSYSPNSARIRSSGLPVSGSRHCWRGVWLR
jgi:hypothetical protein